MHRIDLVLSKQSQTTASDDDDSVSSTLAPDIKSQRVDFDLFQIHCLDPSYTFHYQANRKASQTRKTYHNVHLCFRRELTEEEEEDLKVLTAYSDYKSGIPCSKKAKVVKTPSTIQCVR